MRLAKHVRFWDLHIVEKELSGILGFQTKLFKIPPSFKTIPCRFHQKQGHRVRVILGIRLSGDHHQITVNAIRDIGLLPAQNPMVVLLHRLRTHSC